TPRQKPRLEEVVKRWPLDSVLAALQILAEYRGRMRGSPHGRLLVELALARAARLENLSELSDWIARLTALEAGAPPPATARRKSEPSKPATSPAPQSPARPRTSPPSVVPDAPLDLDAVRRVWPDLLPKIGFLGVYLSPFSEGLSSQLAISGPNVLVLRLP